MQKKLPSSSFVEEMWKKKGKRLSSNRGMAMDETAVWFDCPDNRCIETREPSIMRVTLCLTACSDGRKLLPYVLVNRKRPVPKIVEQFKDKLIVDWNGSVWMDNNTTANFLKQVIEASGVFSSKRHLVWDAFAAHKREMTMSVLKELVVEAAFITGGCTKFIQASDVSWNKPLQEKICKYYTIWMINDSEKEFTAGGNPKAPALEIVLEWVYRAWQELSKEIIVKSFKACALTTATDGTEDDHITCFKPEGSIGTKSLGILFYIRAQITMTKTRF